MAGFSLLQIFNPAGYRRRQAQQQVAALRARDGDCCARCRRPMRFDRPVGHEDAARVEPLLVEETVSDRGSLDNLRLTHGRCNVPGRDHTGEALERLRPAREAELFAKGRDKRAA